MDNVTHAALGLAIAGAGFPTLGTAGVALAVVASELPDVDVFFGLGNPWSMITIHRGITHSIILAPLAAAALAGIWSRFSAAGTFWTFFALAIACLAGHIGLDVLTSYGTQILEPFSRFRTGLGWVAVVDPVVTVALLAGATTAWWLRARHPEAASQAALAGLLITAGYFGLGAWQHHRAMQVVNRETQHLGAPLAADATPQLGTIFVWRLLYRSADTFWLARYNSLTGSIDGAQTLPVNVDQSLASLLATPQAGIFRNFAAELIRPHLDPADPNALIIEDMRFAMPTDSPTGLWALRIAFALETPDHPVVREFEFLQRRLRFQSSEPLRQRVSIIPAMIK